MLLKPGWYCSPLQATHHLRDPNTLAIASGPTVTATVEGRGGEARGQGFREIRGGVSLATIVQITVTFTCSANMYQTPSVCQE